jgi:hypothetical protein
MSSPEVLLMRFFYRMVPEVYQLFWAAMARGEFITDAAAEAGTYRLAGPRVRSCTAERRHYFR